MHVLKLAVSDTQFMQRTKIGRILNEIKQAGVDVNVEYLLPFKVNGRKSLYLHAQLCVVGSS